MKRRPPASFLRLGSLLVLFALGLPLACDSLDDSDSSTGGTGGSWPASVDGGAINHPGGTGGSRPFSVDGGAIRPDGAPMDGKGMLPPFGTGATDGRFEPPSPADGSPIQQGDGASMDAGGRDEDAGEDDAGY